MRPHRDGTPARAPNRRNLTDLYVNKVNPQDRPFLTWDAKTDGLALAVYPTGTKSWKLVYRHNGQPRWFTIGKATTIGLADARKLARRLALRVAEGEDPQAERKAERTAGTFTELATQYVEQYASKRNRSWKQADALVRKYLLPALGKLRAADIERSDIKRVFVALSERPVLANQVLAAAGAMFEWAMREEVGGVKLNPARGIERNATRARERVLSESEVALFWPELTPALKLILLSGQRPGECAHMRAAHLVDGWWEMPGQPVPELGWPGTKNGQDHRVWLSEPARALVEQHLADDKARLDADMRTVVAKLAVERATPHDLRRTSLTMITRLGFGRDARDRIANHRERRCDRCL